MAENPSIENLTKNFITGVESYQPRCMEVIHVKYQKKTYVFYCGKCDLCSLEKIQKGYRILFEKKEKIE